jgi:hypothetical protein
LFYGWSSGVMFLSVVSHFMSARTRVLPKPFNQKRRKL